MKKTLLVIAFIFTLPVIAQQNPSEESLKNAVREGVLQAQRILNEEARVRRTSVPGSIIPKIKPDTITDRQSFDFANTDIIKAEVKDYYYVVSYYRKPYGKERIDKLQKQVGKLNIQVSNLNKTGNISGLTQRYSAKIAKVNDSLNKLQTYNNSLKDLPKDNITIFYTPANPKKKIRISETNGWKPDFSIMTVPFKIRTKNGDAPSQVTADIDNVGVFVSWGKKIQTLSFDNTTSTQKFGFGPFLAPMAEEITPKNATGVAADYSSHQFYLSMGFAITYTYNKITVGIVPLACDTGFTQAAKKWNYNGNYWFGFGLGVDTSLFGF